MAKRTPAQQLATENELIPDSPTDISPRIGEFQSFAVEDAFKKFKSGGQLNPEEIRLLEAARIPELENMSLRRSFEGSAQLADKITRGRRLEFLAPGESTIVGKDLEVIKPAKSVVDKKSDQELEQIPLESFESLPDVGRTPQSVTPETIEIGGRPFTSEQLQQLQESGALSPDTVQRAIASLASGKTQDDFAQKLTAFPGQQQQEVQIPFRIDFAEDPIKIGLDVDKAKVSDPKAPKVTKIAVKVKSENEEKFEEKKRQKTAEVARNSGVDPASFTPETIRQIESRAIESLNRDLLEDSENDKVELETQSENAVRELEQVNTDLDSFERAGISAPESFLNRKEFLESQVIPAEQVDPADPGAEPRVDPSQLPLSPAQVKFKGRIPSTGSLNIPAPEAIAAAGFAQEKEGIARKAEIERIAALSEASLRADVERINLEASNALVVRESNRQFRINNELAKFSEIMDKVQNKKVDPDRWWNSRTTAQKIAAGIGVFLGGIGGGTNQALAIIENAINRDVISQKNNILSEQKGAREKLNMMGIMMTQYKDERAAESASIAWGWKRAENLLKAQTARTNSAITREKARIMQGQLTQKFASNIAKLSQFAAIPLGVSGINPDQVRTEKQRQLYIQQEKSFAPSVQAANKTREFLAEFNSLVETVKRAKAFRKKFGTNIFNLTGGVSARGISLMKALQVRLKGKAFANLGVLNGPDLTFLENLTSKSLTGFGFVMDRLEMIESILTRGRLKFLRGQGVTPLGEQIKTFRPIR